ncbi:MAG TPA: sensor histidine kinase [Saprospiraceae bacterium]|nr:sensor histidine kinase [Saprospiraceae bacterium]
MKTLINSKRYQFYLWVGAIWLVLWTFNSFLNFHDTFVPQTLNEIWRTFYIVVVNFIFFEYSLPFILKKRSVILYNILSGILLITINLLLLSFGLYGWKYLGVQFHIYTPLRIVTLIPDDLYNKVLEEVIYQAQGGIISIFFFGLAKLFYTNFKLRQTTQLLRLEKQEAELNYLKSQTNPHFLFNTLNNIYSLAKDKSDLAPESILRLSKILRFMLYETSGEFISIEQELEIIQNYIALEKLRYDDSLLINFKYDIEDMKQALPPLLLIPLVENAFKHGVSETRNQPFIDIYLLVNQQALTFVIKNSTDNLHEGKNINESIGLSNLRRQLQLLYSDYNLSVQQIETVFTATVKINLISHV